MKHRIHRCAVAAVLFFGVAPPLAGQEARRITILYDAFGEPSALQKDWGYAALVEYGGRRILFYTGNDSKILEHNAKQLGVDLSRLDAVVILVETE
jgi:7,8-dihydropterin-6-yl-methyl-4-(beta-D-ribofuranosyl)aminobenzene 5'-phosphate synthase